MTTNWAICLPWHLDADCAAPLPGLRLEKDEVEQGSGPQC
jgi:hypothetical protein